ncbi:MAG: 3'-5' exonuclease, partial [Bacilli bacterium]
MPDLQSFSFDEFKAMNLSPYQVYGLDIDYQQYYSIQHYLNNKTDVIDKDQILNIVFGDIEVYTANAKVFPKPELAKFPISAITLYNNFNKTFNSYFLLHQFNISKFPNKNQILDLIKRFKKELIENKYIYENENIEIEIFTDELSLIKTCWNKIKDIDPSLLGGWNFDRFDLPYIYFRLGNLLNKNENEIGKILSRFSKIKVEKFGGDYLIKIPEFPVLDLLYAYKPRDDG